jgi:hypothetical protein
VESVAPSAPTPSDQTESFWPIRDLVRNIVGEDKNADS